MSTDATDLPKKNHKGAGRPHKVIDPKLIQKLASIQCTKEEIAAVCGCSVDTLERNFADVIKAGKENGKASLRRNQWKIAESGNASMSIFLGKVYLNQKDESYSAPQYSQIVVERG